MLRRTATFFKSSNKPIVNPALIQAYRYTSQNQSFDNNKNDFNNRKPMGGGNTGVALLATGLLAAAGYYLYNKSETIKREEREIARDINKRMDYVKDRAEDVKDKMMDKAYDMKEKAKDTMYDVKDKAIDVKDKMVDSVESSKYADKAREIKYDAKGMMNKGAAEGQRLKYEAKDTKDQAKDNIRDVKDRMSGNK